MNAGGGNTAPLPVDAYGSLPSAGCSIDLNSCPTAAVFSADNNSPVTIFVDPNQIQIFSVSGTALAQTKLFPYPTSPEGRNVVNLFWLSSYECGGAGITLVSEAVIRLS